MGLWDTLLGRRKPAPPNLDRLFGLPSAAVTLQAGAGYTPTGAGAVAFRATEGAAFAQVQADVTALLEAGGGPPVTASVDGYGYTWLLLRRDPAELPELVTDLHAVNATLQDNGFGPMLLCSLVTFADPAGRRLALVYLYKQGTFYPFAPTGDQQRDNAVELQVRGLVAGDLPIEPDVSRWFPIWGAPGL